MNQENIITAEDRISIAIRGKHSSRIDLEGHQRRLARHVVGSVLEASETGVMVKAEGSSLQVDHPF